MVALIPMSLATSLSRISPVSIPSHFSSFIPGRTPLSTYDSAASALALYFASIYSIQRVLKDQKPVKLNTLFRLHNIILSVGSGLLLVFMLEEVIPIIWERGFFASFCNRASYTPRLEACYIVNYWIKYVELLDTVFLALKKKDLKFLHVFHHSATAVLCLIQLQERTPTAWVVITLNLMVHVLMYYYYYAAAGGAQIGWKKYLTSMQIVQFIIDLSVVGTGSYTEIVSRYAPSLPNLGRCDVTFLGAGSGLFLLAAYLGLFINFYFQTYKARKPATPLTNGLKAVDTGRTGRLVVTPASTSERLSSSH